MKSRILIIDDEVSIRKLLSHVLGQAYDVKDARDGREGLHFASMERPDLVILDMGLPDQHGLQVLKELRALTDVPVIILSVENDQDTIIAALDLGADDYITKPFRNEELLARIRVCLRRTIQKTEEAGLLKLRDLEVDLEKRIVKKSGQQLHLTVTEYTFLVYLLKNRGKVLTHNQILKEVWGSRAASDLSYSRVYVRHLRQKIENNPDDPEMILTETGVGYRMVDS